MALVPAICTQCGAQIEVDDTHEAGVCNHCGTAFITEKAINNYNITNSTTNHISANTVNVYGNDTSDFIIRAGVLEKYVGESANVIIPNNVTMIGENAFADCVGVTSIVIPNSVTSIEGTGYMLSGAFSNCKNLTNIKIPDSVTHIGSSAFRYCEKLTTIKIPDSVISIENSAFEDCKSLTNIILPSSIKCIESKMFKGCESLTTIVIPEGVISIGNSAFFGCSNLVNIAIPKRVTSIGASAFEDCKSLTNIILPNGIKSIERTVLAGCEGLTKIVIPEGVTSIGYAAFVRCKKLTTIIIPDSVVSVERGLPHHDYNTDPFPKNPSLNIVASTEWKTKFYDVSDLLSSYKPTPAKSGCYVATCVYGSYDCPEVWTLRRFRDYTLDETWHGRLFIKCYYAISPTIVKWFGETKWFKTFWKAKLDKMVSDLNNKGIANTSYTDKY